jgi:hypothetical protein
MTRRLFIFLQLFATFSFGFFSFLKKEDKWDVLESVQNQLFPKSKRYPSASEFEAIRYLKVVSKDNSFDKDDLEFLFRGVEEIQSRGYKTELLSIEKEKILKLFSKERFGENWISTVLNYTLEALFSDPLYGGNVKEIGWKSFDHNAGVPRPKRRFGVIHV